MQEALIAKMRKWFYQHFEDPAENTPYMTSEGGYIWVHGGPYDAREELQAAFGHEVSEDLIHGLAGELTQQCLEWAPVAVPEYDDEYYSDRFQEYEYIDAYGNFKKAIKNVEALLNIEIGKATQQHLHRMLFVSAITAMETYLSDAFINTVMPEQDLLRRLVETSPEFKKKTIAISELFNSMDNIREEVKRYLSEYLGIICSAFRRCIKLPLTLTFQRISAKYTRLYVLVTTLFIVTVRPLRMKR